MQSTAKTVSEYLRQLPPDRRAAISAVRAVIRKHLPTGYTEMMQYGMMAYVVPLSRYPAGYLGDPEVPVTYAALASQKNHMAVYLMNIYAERDAKTKQWFFAAYRKSGKRMDVGKSCVRFRKLEDLPLDVIGQAIARTSMRDYITMYEMGLKSRKIT